NSLMTEPGEDHIRNEMLAFDTGAPVRVATSISSVTFEPLIASGRYQTRRESGTATYTCAPTPDPPRPRTTSARKATIASRLMSLGTVYTAEYVPTDVRVEGRAFGPDGSRYPGAYAISAVTFTKSASRSRPSPSCVSTATVMV